MTLYFRFLIILIKALFAPKKALLEPSTLHFRVLPFDCDINLHLNNARYLSFMDLGRLYLLGQDRLFTLIRKHRWMPVIAAIEVTYLKALDPFQRFKLDTRILAWDEYYLYMEQRFETEQGLAAIALIKATIVSNQGKLPVKKILETAGVPDMVSPPLPQAVLHWKELTAAKKQGS